jgi:hypothetical protein
VTIIGHRLLGLVEQMCLNHAICCKLSRMAPAGLGSLAMDQIGDWGLLYREMSNEARGAITLSKLPGV